MSDWKWIDGYEDMYKIYKNGSVESYKKSKPIILKTQINKCGYIRVQLCKNGERKKFSIHRLLAIHFINNPNGYLVVDHIDINKLNNSLENLRWVTQSMNTRNQKNTGKYMKGVAKKNKKFEAHITIKGKYKYLGTFNTELEANQAYMKEYDEIMNEFN